MMSVIIDDKDVVHFTFRLEPTTCASETLKRFRDLIERHFKFKTYGDRRERVIDVVDAWHAKRDFADHIGTAPYGECRTEVVVVTNAMSRDIGLCAQPVRHTTSYQLWNDRLHIRIVE